MAYSRVHVDADQLIADIQSRPGLYDLKSPVHSNKFIKDRLWEDVCSALFKNWDRLDSDEKADKADSLPKTVYMIGWETDLGHMVPLETWATFFVGASSDEDTIPKPEIEELRISASQVQQQRLKKSKIKEIKGKESFQIDLKDLLIKVGEKITSPAPIQDEEQMYNLQSASGKELTWSYGYPNIHTMEQDLQSHYAGLKKELYYNIVKKETITEEVIRENNLQPKNTVNVTIDGNTCVLFGFKRIIIRFKNQTQMDLTNTNLSLYDSVDMEDSNCNEENTTFSLTFHKGKHMKGLTIRFLLVKSYYKLSVQNWFKLESVQILFNQSVQATFNSTKIFAPISYSYHCQHVSSLQKYNALLVPSSEDNSSALWDITFLDFQIQGFNIEEGEFSYAKDCTTYFSSAILMGLVMSLILLLVLAYALHMLMHLKSMDRHYQRKCSAIYFPKIKDNYLEDEREPLRGCGREFYELRQPEYCRLSIQQCASVSH
ncbi:uncharacterized protein ACMZJ9_002945 [Mantella aurantiaca]